MALNRDKLNEIAQPRSQEEIEAAEQRKAERNHLLGIANALSEEYIKPRIENIEGYENYSEHVKKEAMVFDAYGLQEAFEDGFLEGIKYARLAYHID